MSGMSSIKIPATVSPAIRDYMSLVTFCRRLGVLRLKLGEFEVEFKENDNETQSSPKKQVKSKVHAENNESALRDQEADVKNRQVDEALIIDPSLAESLILEGKLTDG